jgi:hypothetical protein
VLPAILISLCKGYKQVREVESSQVSVPCVWSEWCAVELEKFKELALEGPQVLPFIVQGRSLGVQEEEKQRSAWEGILEAPRAPSLYAGFISLVVKGGGRPSPPCHHAAKVDGIVTVCHPLGHSPPLVRVCSVAYRALHEPYARLYWARAVHYCPARNRHVEAP